MKNSPRKQIAIITFIINIVVTVKANDGFFQGAGSDLVQIKNATMRVVSEKLEITPFEKPHCYQVYYKDSPLKDFYKTQIDTNKIFVGPEGKCEAELVYPKILRTYWKASATYQILANKTQKDVQIGFPVPQWEAQFEIGPVGLESVQLPGVAKFHTFIDGTEIAGTTQRKLQMMADGRHGEKTERKVPGYAWKASFEAKKRYTLKTEYEFGIVGSNAYYEDREYPKGVKPWFIKAKLISPDSVGVSALLYYVSPLKTWATPPPKTVSIKIALPVGLPVPYLVPVGLKPTCVEEHTFYFKYKNEVPSGELDLTYPHQISWPNLKGIASQKQFDDWKLSLGNAKFSCSLIKSMKTIKDDNCVDRCL